MRRFLGVFALAALMVTTVAPAALAAQPLGLSPGKTITRTSLIQANKSLSGQIAKSDTALLARNDTQLVNVMIKLDVDALATYKGGINGLQATSPSVTGKALKENGAAVAAYRGYLANTAANVSRNIQRVVPGAQLGKTFLVAFGGIAARLPANQARKLINIKGVAAVMYDTQEKPLTDASPHFVGADLVWPMLGGSITAGEGVKVGIIDTGIWPEHPSFQDLGIDHPGGTYGCEFGGSGNPDDPAFACNDKLIGAYAFLDTYVAVVGGNIEEYCTSAAACSARDAEGHGTHTSSTSAGDGLSTAVLFGVERGPISGMAPGAHVIMYRVCMELGCFSSDSVNAVEQAITDDVDVINFSISGGEDPYSDSVELAFLDAYAAGISVNASAGNSGPGAATAAHGGPWVNTVGASTSDRHFISTLHLAADGGATFDVQGVTITAGITSPTPVVLASDPPYNNELCDAPAAPGTFTGMVVVCVRGVVGRAEKGFNVLQGDAAGMILLNASPGQTDLETDNHWLPAIHAQWDGGAVPAFVASHTNVTAWWTTGVATHVQGDVMASFSSRGPLGDFIKPDVTAPGVQILAGHSPEHIGVANGPDGQLFQAIAGTSMSSPHAAGVAALLKAAHPGWTPGEIKSAMMTSGSLDVFKEDGVTPADPFDRGGGSIRANRAVQPTVVFDVNPVDYYAASDDQFGRINLNTASINAPRMPGTISTWRTARNVSGQTQTLDLSATSPSGSKITLSPKKITIGPWQTKSFFITIDGTKLTDGQYFGQITLNPRAGGFLNAVMPVAFNKGPGQITLVNSCDSTTIAAGTETGCDVTVQNLSSSSAHVSVKVKGPKSRRLVINDWSAGNKKGNGFIWNGQLSPSLPPEILALVTPDGGPGGGYLPLSAFGIPPEAGYGDETIGNYSGFGTFSYGHELYDTVAVDSNGYVVVGGGDAEDNNCCAPSMPSPSRPNNVIAPYWTDLDPSSGGAIYVGILGDGVNEWFVADWEDVPVFGQPTETRSFQVWLQLGDTTMEGIWMEHGETGPGAIDGLVVGAENRDGSDAAALPFDTPPTLLGYQVVTGSPTPGGSMTISYDAFGRNAGTYNILSTMVSDATQGTATDLLKITVTP
jgi:subtilisin family serine protease